MDILTFIAKIFEFASWPIASVVIFLFLKKEIKQLTSTLRTLKAGPFDAAFGERVEKLQDQAESIVLVPENQRPEQLPVDPVSNGATPTENQNIPVRIPEPETALPAPMVPLGDLIARVSVPQMSLRNYNILSNLAYTNPQSAILEAWRYVERAVISVAEQLDLLYSENINSFGKIIESLSSKNKITADEASLLLEMQKLRNLALHEQKFSPAPQDAKNYVRLAYNMIKSNLGSINRR